MKRVLKLYRFPRKKACLEDKSKSCFDGGER